MAKKKKRVTKPKFPEREALLALVHMNTELAFAKREESKENKLSPELKKILQAIRDEDMCGEGNEKAASVVKRAYGVDLSDMIFNGDDDDSSLAGAGVAVVHPGSSGTLLFLGNDSTEYQSEVVNASGATYAISKNYRKATSQEIEKLNDLQLKMYLGKLQEA